ncbi:MAG TPA: PSD1 and planctomycete cytochrome C domain-containing protein [Chthoniobacteraceae bacterium]|jgi:mono/diheme cytochrome c family protein|nr:PSD1 and planctomycete cytochrome C domain-containing protein [Chthoniobacteraceae bacterium]
MRFVFLQATACALLVAAGARLHAAEPATEEAAFFEKRIRPLLADHCYKCHSAEAEKVKGGLLLDSRAGLLKGGETRPGIVPGVPEKSLLIAAVNWKDEDLQMPPKKKLTEAQIADLTEWVKMGAPWPGGDQTAAPVAKKEFAVTDKDRAHWAFRPVKKPAPPAVKNQGRVANPVDAFVLAKLEAKGLTPNGPADKRALVRRVYYDVTGLPPSPEEVEAFVADTSPKAWEALVDRLLASPHYGEQWGRHWLDLVRFAETNSYERDNDKPRAWRYRDYVIRAFNDDKPYDQFVREQLAGDELPDRSAESIIATGYYRLGIWDDEPVDGFQARFDMLDDIVATTGQVMLGLTVDCARCHDHKIDPIGQRDYYALLSFFHNVNYYRNGGATDEVPLPGLTGIDPDPFAGKREGLEMRIAEIEEHFRERHPQGVVSSQLVRNQGERYLGKETLDRYLQFKKELDALKNDKVTGNKALAVTEAGVKPPETFILLRGNPANKGDKVEPAFLQVLDPPPPVIVAPTGVKSSGRRLALANWIASRDNQLTARVMVNRVWQHHFGRGLVRSPNNFGVQGDAPTHPELLDWLASEFVEQGWSLKALHRLILTSNTYRMSARPSPAALKADPPNDLLSHFDMRRLTAEEIRDSLLAVTGTLNPEMFGPSIYVEIPKEVLAGQSLPGRGWGKSSPEEQARRSIYIFVKRSLITPILASFDQAETDRSAPVRFASTQPTQALGMLNSAFVNEQAGKLAARIRREGGSDIVGQVRLALQLATSRPPSDVEIKRGVAFIEALQKTDGAAPEAALKTFCLLALNLNEFLYLD